MHAHRLITGFAIVSGLLAGCAHAPGPSGKIPVCVSSTCPVVLESRFLRGYAADPETIFPLPPVSRIVVWSFRASDGTFDVRGAPADGIIVPSAPDPASVGITDCRPSADPQGISEVPAGRYYRCRVRGKAPPFTVAYTLQFHDGSGRQRQLDPYATNSGGAGDQDVPPPVDVRTKPFAGRIVRIALSPGGPDPEPVPLPTGGSDAVVLVWAAPAGSLFDTDPFQSEADGVSFEQGTGTNRPPCRATSDPDGASEVESGPYYRCTLWPGLQIAGAYQVQYRTGTVVTRLRGTLR